MSQQFWRDAALPFAESRRAWQSRSCYRPHTHPALSIGAVDAGRSRLQVEGRADQALAAGDIVLIPAGAVHACNPEPDCAWSYQMLYLAADWVATLQHEAQRDQGARLLPCPTHYRDPALYQDFCALNTLLFEALPAELKEDALIDFAGRLLLGSMPAPEAPPPWLPALKAQLEAECCAHWPLQQLATDAGLSRYHLIRLFRQHTGLTPHAFQLDCRINLARRLLREGAAQADLAQQLGFADQSHFQRAFRARVSATPGQYQQQTRS